MKNVSTPSAAAHSPRIDAAELSLFGPSAFENADGQWDFGVEDGKVPSASEPDSEGGPGGEVDALLAELQTELLGERDLPACKRSAETFAVPTWHERSERSRREEFEQPPKFAPLTQMSDARLASDWGWVLKHRGRGLSKRDQAVQREVYARCLGAGDLVGLDLSKSGSGPLRELVRKRGCWSSVALGVMGLIETVLARGKMGLRLSAPDFHALTGHAKSTWWYAVKRLEALGIVQRVEAVKGDTQRFGGAPVQRDTNLYVPGPWWFERSEGETWSPLEAALGLFAKVRRKPMPGRLGAATKRAHESLMNARRQRRRKMNQQSRDRNRKRLHNLPPKVASTAEVEAVADALAAKRQAEVEAQAAASARGRAQALMRGEPVAVGPEVAAAEATPVPAPEVPELEEAAATAVKQANAGEKPKRSLGGVFRRALGLLTGAPVPAPSSENVSHFNCHPSLRRQSRRGRTKEEIISTAEPQPSPESPPPQPDAPPTLTKTPSRAPKFGDTSGPARPACDRARALDGRVLLKRASGEPKRSEPLRGPALFRQAFAELFGRELEPGMS